MKNKSIYPWVVVGLLWIVALLNYMDRQMLSTMQEAMKVDIVELNKAEAFGALMAIFLWIYGFMSPIAGMIADRVNRKWLVVGSLFVWSAVTFLMGYAQDFHELYWLRAIMGVSEALYIPSALSLIADWHEGKSRSLAVGVHMTGLYVGQAIGGFGATAAAAFSWQATFHWFGIVGIAYSLVLILFLKENPIHNIAIKEIDNVPKEKNSSVISGLSLLFTNWAFWIILIYFAAPSLPGWATKNWLPTLFHDNLGLDMNWAGPMATLTIAVSSFIGVMIGGPISDRWVKKNVRGRIYTSAIGMAMMIPALVFVGLAHNALLSVLAGFFFGVGYGMFDANNMPILCQFVSSRQRAMAYGFMNSLGVIMGAVTTQLLGGLADSIGLGSCFAFMGAIVVVALVLQLVVLRPKSDDKDDEEAAAAHIADAEAETAQA